jgi:uncharacterized membrane protein
MSDLVAIAYDDQETAETVRKTLFELSQGKVVELDDAVVVTRDDNGKVGLHQAFNPVASGAAGGAIWGSLIGLIFLMPLMGLLIGAASGALGGTITDVGVNDNFMKELGGKLTPGTSALVLLIRKSTPDKMLPRIEQYGGHVIQTSLSDEEEQRLRTALGE